MMAPNDSAVSVRKSRLSARVSVRLREIGTAIVSLMVFYYASMTGAASSLIASILLREREPFEAARDFFQVFRDMPSIAAVWLLLLLTIFGVVPALILRDAFQRNHGQSFRKATITAAIVTAFWCAALFCAIANL